MLVKPTSWFKHGRTGIHSTVFALALDRDQEVVLASLTIELRGNFDLLASCEKVSNRHTCDTRHFRLVKDAHELLHETQW